MFRPHTYTRDPIYKVQAVDRTGPEDDRGEPDPGSGPPPSGIVELEKIRIITDDEEMSLIRGGTVNIIDAQYLYGMQLPGEGLGLVVLIPLEAPVARALCNVEPSFIVFGALEQFEIN